MAARVGHRVLSPLGLVFAIAGGCATGAQSTSLTRMEIVRIPDARSDSTPSRLAVVVRYVDRPAVPVEGAQVRVTRAGTPAASLALVRDSLATAQGIVSLTGLAPGEYDVLVRRVGTGAAHVRVRLTAECNTTLEVYLVVIGCDIGYCPPAPTPRTTFTTCDRTR